MEPISQDQLRRRALAKIRRYRRQQAPTAGTATTSAGTPDTDSLRASALQKIAAYRQARALEEGDGAATDTQPPAPTVRPGATSEGEAPDAAPGAGVPIAPIAAHDAASAPTAPPATQQPAAGEPSLGQRARSAAGALVQGAAGPVSGTLKSIPILAARINEAVPEALKDPTFEGEGAQIDQRALYRMGEAIDQFVETTFPTDPRLQERFIEDVLPRAIGSMATFLAGGAGARLARGSTTAAASALGGSAEAAQQYEAAKAAGADEQIAQQAATRGAALGLTEGLPVGRAVSRLARGGGAVRKGLAGAAEEAAQETIQGAGGNVIAQQLYDPERETLEGVGPQAGAGGVVGFLTNAALTALSRRARRPPASTAPPDTDAQADAAPPTAPPQRPAGPETDVRAEREDAEALPPEAPGDRPGNASPPRDQTTTDPSLRPPGEAATGEQIDAAAVLAGGNVYTGATHGEAINKALDAGALVETEQGFESADGSPADIDLFTTSGGRLIDRFQASAEFGAGSAEAAETIAQEPVSPAGEQATAGAPVPKEQVQDTPPEPAPQREIVTTDTGEVDVEASGITGEREYLGVVARASESPEEIALAARRARELRQPMTPAQEATAEFLRNNRLSIESFEAFGDPNIRSDNPNITRQYLASEGEALDTAARQISEAAGTQVTPQDLVDFIESNPRGVGQFERSLRTATEAALEDRFREVTGGTLTERRLVDLTAPPEPVTEPERATAPFAPIRELSQTSDAAAPSEPRRQGSPTTEADDAGAAAEPPAPGTAGREATAQPVDDDAPAVSRGGRAADVRPGTSQRQPPGVAGQGDSRGPGTDAGSAETIDQVAQGRGTPPGGRIPIRPEPPPAGSEPQKRDDILLRFEESVGQRLRQGATLRRGQGGAYYPGSSRTAIRFRGDLDTAAHEIAHALDDRYGLVAEWAEARSSPFDRELIPHFSQFGSPSDSKTYQRAEGVAEWIRAYVADPEAASEAAPRFAEHFRETLPESTLQAIDQFGRDVRQWAGQSAEARTTSNIETDTTPARLLDRVKEGLQEDELGMEWATQGERSVTDSLAPLWKGVALARKLRGLEDLLPSRDPKILIRTFAGFDTKFDDVVEHGMVDANDQRLEGARGFDHLFEPLDTSSREALQQDLEGVMALMVNQRVIEKAERLREAALTIEQAEGDLTMTREQIAEVQEQMQAIRDELAATRRQRDTGGRIERGRIGQLQDALRSHNDQLQDLQQQRRQIKKDERAARKRLGYQGPTGEALNYATRKASRLAGTGAGVYSDVRQAREAIEEVQADPERLARLQEAAGRYRAWADQVLRYAVGKGRLSEEAYQTIRRENEQYVAMNRIMDEIGPELYGRGQASRRLGSVGEPIKRFRGSTRQIQNPYVSLLMQTNAIMREADRNEALRSVRDLLTTDRGMYESDVLDLDAIGSRAKEGDPDTIKIFVDGKAEYWQFHPDIFKALKDWGETSRDNIVFRILQIPARVAHDAITHAPAFLVRNLSRDPIQRSVVSETGSKPWGHLRYLRQGGKEELRRLWSDFHRYGGGQFGFYRNTRDGYYQRLTDAVEKVVGRDDSILTTPRRLARGYKRMAESSETVGRIEEYRSAYKKAREELGYSERDAGLWAAFQARDITDYAVAGTAVREINKYVPFTNAAVQGLLRSMRGLERNPAGFVARWSAYVLSQELMNYAWNVMAGTDDELRQQPAYLRDLFWNYKLTDDLWLRVPKPWELGVMASGFSRGIDYLRGDEHAFDGWLRSMTGALAPLDERALAGPFVTYMEAWMGKDMFRDRFIVPPWEEGKRLELREGTARASRLGQVLQQAVGIDARKMDFIIESQFGGLGRLATKASDLGREDTPQNARSVGMEAAGLFTRSPAYSARDVQWVFDWARAEGKMQDDRVDRLKDLLGRYFEADSARQRDRLARGARNYATSLRQRLDR